MQGFPERLVSLQPFWGSWKLDALIGEGSYGKVYRIKREEFNDVYYAALKWIALPQSQSEISAYRNEGRSDEEIRAHYTSVVQELKNEITVMSQLRGNSHIVSFEDHAFIERKDGIGWDVLIRMELLTPLSSTPQESLTVDDVVRLGCDLCDALTLCGKSHIIHRDIKPDNIFVNANGDYKIGDFGMARQMEKTQGNMSRKGTPFYMAPEVYLGRTADASVDQYSLGLVMHRLLNGQRIPFSPDTDRILTHMEREEAFEKRMSGQPIPPPLQGSVALKRVISKACSFNPKNRYIFPAHLKTALLACLNERQNDEPLLSSVNAYVVSQRSSSVGFSKSFLSSQDKSNKVATQNKGSGYKKIIVVLLLGIVILCGVAVWLLLQEDVSGGTSAQATSIPVAEITSEVTTLPVVTDAPTPAAGTSAQVPVVDAATMAPTAVPTAAPTPVVTPVPAMVYFPSAAAESAVRLKLNKMDGAITPEDALRVTALDLSGETLTDISFLSDFTNLEELSIRASHLESPSNALRDISALSNLSQLRELRITGGNITSFAPLEQLTNLEVFSLDGEGRGTSAASAVASLKQLPKLRSLSLNGNNISDLSMLSGLERLQELVLSNNSITNLSPISNFYQLTRLSVNVNAVSDLSPLSGMTKMEYLHISGDASQPTALKGLDVLSGMTQLRTLNLGTVKFSDFTILRGLTQMETIEIRGTYSSRNTVKGLSTLKEMPNLKSLTLTYCKISDVSALRDLHQLEYLNLHSNSITDISSLSNLTNLRYLSLSHNKLKSLSPLADLVNMETLYLRNVGISKLSALSGMTKLETLDLGDNKVSDTSPLSNLTNLRSLDLSGNSVKDISPLSNLVYTDIKY